MQVLIVFFIIIIFIIPGYFLNMITEGEKDVGGVDVDNRRVFTDLINENMLGKHIPGMFAQSAEFSKMKITKKEELTILSRIKQNEEVKEAIPKQKEGRPPI